jgi:hypothetical protein
MTRDALRVLEAGSLTAGDLQRWRELSEAAIEPNLFLGPDYCAPLLTVLHEHGVRVVVSMRDGTWVAAIAVAGVRARLLGAPHRVLTTGGPVIDHLFRTHPVVRPESPGRDLAALFRGLADMRMGGIIHLDDYFADGPFAVALADAVGELRAPTLVDDRGPQAFASRAAPVPEAERDMYGPAHVSKSRRNKLRRDARLLADRAGGPLAYVNHGADPAAVRAFVSLQAAGWKGDAGRGGKALALNQTRVRALEEAVVGSAEDGSMFVGALEAGSRTVYMVVAMRQGQRLVCDVLDTYDEDFRDVSAGTLGRLAHLAYVRRTWPSADFDPAIRSSAAVVAGLYPEARQTQGIHVAAGGPGARATIRGAARMRALRGN